MGVVVRDIPCPHSRHSNGYMYLCPVGRLLHLDILFPLYECSIRFQRQLLDIQCYMPVCLHLPVQEMSRNKREGTGVKFRETLPDPPLARENGFQVSSFKGMSS
jgi:hypothetical protein